MFKLNSSVVSVLWETLYQNFLEETYRKTCSSVQDSIKKTGRPTSSFKFSNLMPNLDNLRLNWLRLH